MATTIFVPYNSHVYDSSDSKKGIYEDQNGKWTVCEKEDGVNCCYRVESKEIAFMKLKEMQHDEHVFAIVSVGFVIALVVLAVWLITR